MNLSTVHIEHPELSLRQLYYASNKDLGESSKNILEEVVSLHGDPVL